MREQVPGFRFMAEVYWDLEWTLQQQGFDYAYDKRLYDRLREGHARPVREHLHAGLDYQDKLARFLENHDEPRAAATFSRRTCTRPRPSSRSCRRACGSSTRGSSRADGSASRRTWSARPLEPVDDELQQFYDRSWRCSGSRSSATASWQLLECVPAWEGNWTSDGFIALPGRAPDGQRRLVAVNYAAAPEPVLRAPAVSPSSAAAPCGFKDLMRPASYDRDGNDLVSRGLYLDLPPWGYHVFEVTAV